MKSINAQKCKDGWLVTIKDSRNIGCESDVLKFIRQEGLKVTMGFPLEEGEEKTWYYAE